MKKLLPVMIAAAMLAVCLVSLIAEDSDADVDEGFWVNNVKITRESDASGNGWTYTKESNTLTLRDGIFTTNHTDEYDGGMWLDAHQRCSPIYYGYTDVLNIVLRGHNVIRDYGPGQAGGELSANGILVAGDVVFSGDGALDVLGGGTNGIIAGGKITISGGIINISGSFDKFEMWAADDGVPSSFTMTDGRLNLQDNDKAPKDPNSLLVFCDGPFDMKGGVINTAGIIRLWDYNFTYTGGLITNGSMAANDILVDFETSAITGGDAVLHNVVYKDGLMADQHEYACVNAGAASIGTGPEKKFVILNANEGSCDKYYVETGTDGKLASLPDATRDGYDFDGWFTAADGGDKVDVSKVYTEDTTIYAHWSKPAGGGSGSNDNLPLIIGGVVAGVLVVGAVAFFLIKKH